MKLVRLVSLAFFILIAAPPVFAQSAPNPTAQSVNEEQLFKQEKRIDGRITIPDERARFLIQPQGRDWRQFHEVYLPWIAGSLIILMLIGLILFYLIAGPVRATSRPTGQRLVRFPPIERFTHWMVATSFIILTLSGLNYIFGKIMLMPLIGAGAFGELSQWAKYAHNFFAWPFVIGVAMMVIFWTRDNLFRASDWQWLRARGGLIGGAHVSAGRFNAGQKMMFWSVALGGLLMFVSGLALLFPFGLFDIAGMQWSQIVHGIIGAIFITGILAHIYIGTIGMEGAFEAMGEGTVDVSWARQHHDLWADEVSGSARSEPVSSPTSGARQHL